ncbi:CRISPR-associated helicase/endonuclease Cas3 [Pyrococcus furiosus DSM 3638]|uniref:CRISPR-associated helicase/endonuclease Cas3 n=2 Tax=Pyrococcus furiosus TaxID=2261 RepID=A0A5C0XQG1_PYRFU|nr:MULTISPECIES: CRISPR-associated helicase/endonuclease Cas3 [Pyrococcus]AFN03911.1 ATP-dependent RNA helicase [Pyrococcus furiosus COM1]MDK2869867.1 CRISPR-associated endonuclease/helicase Cas3 [Pyrococcus sp.]QEK78775.1 CRISPR-associated helicase/endonuclease Cas3 [Pyrococcus furiosus DSM 3638]
MKPCFAKFLPHDFLECHVMDIINVLKSMKVAFPWLEGIFPEVWTLAFYAIVLHDLGKCALGFQKNPKKWGYRHEILSTPFIQFLDFKDEHKMLIGLSILTHHRPISEVKNYIPIEGYREAYEEKVEELLENREYIELYFSRVPLWEIYVFGERKDFFVLPKNWEEKIRNFRFEELLDWYEDKVNEFKDYMTVLKGLLNACDHLASAGETTIRFLPDIEELVEMKIPRGKWRPLQLLSSTTEGNAILYAPTGYGKTEAALLWANKNAHKVKKGISSRIFYILPYKASINAMHRRLLEMFKDPGLVGLLHSSSGIYLYSSSLEHKRLQSLYGKIYSPLKITTPFQIMKAFFGVGFFEITLVELMNSLLIFDEIHAYEPNILGIILAMLELLKDKNVKVLVMTATFPKFLEELIKSVLNPKELKTPPEEADKFTRHRVNIIEGDIQSLDSEEFSGPRPTLIACNTVNTAIDVYSRLKESGANVMLIHGRFTYGDREEKEKRLMSSLNNYDFVVATQVIEVSLDIDFGSIITEPAPLDALIQRFGRVNRRGFGNPRDVYVLTKGSEDDKKVYKPYEVVEETVKILRDLDGKELKESLIPSLITEAYEKEEKKIVSKVLEYKEDALNLFKDIRPMDSYIKGETAFYELFGGLEAIPGAYQHKADELLKKGYYMEVHKYLVPIPYWLFFSEQENFHRLSDRGPGRYLLVAELDYSPEMGLLRKPREGDIL